MEIQPVLSIFTYSTT